MHQLKLVYDFFNCVLPSDLMTLFTRASDVHPTQVLNSSINNLLYIPKINTTTYGNKSLKYKCATLWNKNFKNGSIQVKDSSQPNCRIRLSNIRSKFNFNNALKRHFLYQYSIDDGSVFFRFEN